MLPPFTIQIKYTGRIYNLRVEQIHLDQRTERFRIGSDRSNMIIETNRPFFRNKKLMHRKPDVKHIDGNVPRGTMYDMIVHEVIRMADELTKPQV